MEPSQVLRVGVKPADSFGDIERFYARMNKDGRITIPKLTLDLLQDGEEGLVGKVLAVELEPLEDSA